MLTSARLAIKEKWRNLPKRLRKPFQAQHFKNTVYNTALSTFGKSTKKTADWFEAHSELMPAIKDKRRALAAYKACLSEYNLQAVRAARSQVQQAARRCSNYYWLQLCSQIQIAADTGNIKGMYDGIKQALGPIQKKSASFEVC